MLKSVLKVSKQTPLSDTLPVAHHSLSSLNPDLKGPWPSYRPHVPIVMAAERWVQYPTFSRGAESPSTWGSTVKGPYSLQQVSQNCWDSMLSRERRHGHCLLDHCDAYIWHGPMLSSLVPSKPSEMGRVWPFCK